MNLSYRIANHISSWIHKNKPESASTAVHVYALVPWINLIPCIIVLFVLFLFTGRLLDGVISTIAFIFLRQFSGGVHFRSATKCNIVSTIFIAAAVFLPSTFWYFGFAQTIAAVIVLFLFAPSHVEGQEVDNKQLLRRMKIISIVIVLSNLLFQNHVLSWAFLIQSSLSLPYVHMFANRLKL